MERLLTGIPRIMRTGVTDSTGWFARGLCSVRGPGETGSPAVLMGAADRKADTTAILGDFSDVGTSLHEGTDLLNACSCSARELLIVHLGGRQAPFCGSIDIETRYDEANNR